MRSGADERKVGLDVIIPTHDEEGVTSRLVGRLFCWLETASSVSNRICILNYSISGEDLVKK